MGKNFNNTSAGIHADGLLKNEEIYNAFDTAKILNRPIRITITDKSGKAGIVHWLNSRLKLEGERAVDKNHPGVAKIFKRIMEMYESGRCTSISDEEMENMARRYLSELFVSEFDQLKQKAYKLAAHLAADLALSEEIRSMDPARHGADPAESPGQLPLHPVHVCGQPGRAQDHQEYHPHRRPGQVRRDETG